jgi:superfamily II DNA or RNA helicase
MQLREYQIEVIERVRKACACGARAVCVCLPTGAGKSYIAADLIRKMLAKNRESRIWFCVPRLELLAQMRRVLADAGVFCGEISARTKDFTTNVCICSKDTIARLAGLPTPNVIFFDEAHVAIDQQQAIAARYPAALIIGLTATPEIADGRPLRLTKFQKRTVGLYDALVSARSIPELQRQNVLARLDYKSIAKADAQKFGVLDSGALEVGQSLDKVLVYADIVKEYEKYGVGKPAIGFASTIAIADKCVTILNAAGYHWKRISGDMPLKQRQRLIADLTARRIDGLVNAMLLTYGFDAPCIEYAFSVRYVRSRTLWVQMVGRVLRAAPGKHQAVFVDLTGCCYNFEEQGQPFFFTDEQPRWNFEGKNIVRCLFRLEHVCIHKQRRTQPHCVWHKNRTCNAPLYWFNPHYCSKRHSGACSTVITPPKPRSADKEILQLDRAIISINMHTQIQQAMSAGRISKTAAVEQLLHYADLMGYHPMWVYWFMNKANADVDTRTLTEIARVKGYKHGWVFYKAQEIEEKRNGLHKSAR